MGEPVRTALSAGRFECFREIAAHLGGRGNAYFVGKPWGHVRLVDDHRDFEVLGGQNHGDGDKAALGENDIRAIALEEPPGLPIALQNPKGVRKIFKVKVTAQLPRGDAVVGNACIFNEPALNSLVGADIADLVVRFL